MQPLVVFSCDGEIALKDDFSWPVSVAVRPPLEYVLDVYSVIVKNILGSNGFLYVKVRENGHRCNCRGDFL